MEPKVKLPSVLVTKENAERHKNSPKCTAFEYPMGDKDINVAFIEIDGRYPDRGLVTNEKVKEIVFVTKGEGKIFVDGKEYALKAEDSILLLPKQKYYFDGKLSLVVSCSPAWTPEQHKLV